MPRPRAGAPHTTGPHTGRTKCRVGRRDVTDTGQDRHGVRVDRAKCAVVPLLHRMHATAERSETAHIEWSTDLRRCEPKRTFPTVLTREDVPSEPRLSRSPRADLAAEARRVDRPSWPAPAGLAKAPLTARSRGHAGGGGGRAVGADVRWGYVRGREHA